MHSPLPPTLLKAKAHWQIYVRSHVAAQKDNIMYNKMHPLLPLPFILLSFACALIIVVFFALNLSHALSLGIQTRRNVPLFPVNWLLWIHSVVYIGMAMKDKHYYTRVNKNYNIICVCIQVS